MANAAKHGVEKARGEHAIGGVEKRPRDREDAHRAAPAPAFEKSLGVPGEEAYGADGREVQEAAFDAPVPARARRSNCWRRAGALPMANCWSWTACWKVLYQDGIENYHAGGWQAREHGLCYRKWPYCLD